MASFAQGRYALAISDRSGMAFPYNEMVTEWNGAFVHISEYEAKQPQLDPKPTSADPQALPKVRPARVEPPTQDFLPDNPFTTALSTTLTISFVNGALVAGDQVRFQNVKSPVGGQSITNLQLSTTLNGTITAIQTTVTLTDASAFPTSGYILIEKVLKSTDAEVIANSILIGTYQNEIINYTGKTVNQLTGCTRGTAAPFRGTTGVNTTAGAHTSGALVFGSYAIASLLTVTQASTGQPATVTSQKGLTVTLVNASTSVETGGGFQCTIGPVNDRA